MPSGRRRFRCCVLNVTYPLVPGEVSAFCAGKRAVLVVEEGQPEYIERDVIAALRRLDVQTPRARQGHAAGGGRVHGRGARARLRGIHRAPPAAGRASMRRARGSTPTRSAAPRSRSRPGRCRHGRRAFASAAPSGRCSRRSSSLRPQVGPVHIAADIGCHALATFEPFSSGHSILGYGMSLASRAGVSPMMSRRSLAIMGDGGFWHNGLLTGVQSALFNGDDAVLVIMKNGYTSATGTQDIISTPDDDAKAAAPPTQSQQSLVAQNQLIERTLQGPRRAMDAHGRQLRRDRDAPHARRGVHDTVQRAQGDHRRRRVPARAPAPHQAVDRVDAQARRACRAREVRRRRRRVHRRPRVHPAVGLPDAELEGQPRSAEDRPGGHGASTAASAAGCAARTRMRRRCARASIAPR